ncbi:MAG TPA: DUF4870 domain-containing protein [Longimicrobiaceae bacterium]|nr:DUF4870 domain-containing protein [Longimicrobiaceae bacterium]
MSETPSTPQGTTGLAPNVAGALSYLVGPITGILFLVLEKESRFVRFHAAQSIGISIALFAVNVVLMVLGAVLAVVPIIGWLIGLALSLAVGLGGFVLWLYLMYRAYQGDEWEVPGVGAQVRRYLGGGTAVAPHQ